MSNMDEPQKKSDILYFLVIGLLILLVIFIPFLFGMNKENTNSKSNECKDSDSTNTDWISSLKIKGTCTDANGSYTDAQATTLANGVREYYCSPTSALPEQQICSWSEYSCLGNLGADYMYKEGACVAK